MTKTSKTLMTAALGGLMLAATVSAASAEEAKPADAKTRECLDESKKFVGLATLGNENRNVLGTDHSEITVQPLHRMNEHCRRSRGGERCCDLAANQPGLTDA